MLLCCGVPYVFIFSCRDTARVGDVQRARLSGDDPDCVRGLSGCVATQNGHHADRVRGRWVRFKTHDGFREGLWQCCVAHSICAQGRVRDILRARHEGGDPASRVRMTRFVLR